MSAKQVFLLVNSSPASFFSNSYPDHTVVRPQQFIKMYFSQATIVAYISFIAATSAYPSQYQDNSIYTRDALYAADAYDFDVYGRDIYDSNLYARSAYADAVADAEYYNLYARAPPTAGAAAGAATGASADKTTAPASATGAEKPAAGEEKASTSEKTPATGASKPSGKAPSAFAAKMYRKYIYSSPAVKSAWMKWRDAQPEYKKAAAKKGAAAKPADGEKGDEAEGAATAETGAAGATEEKTAAAAGGKTAPAAAGGAAAGAKGKTSA